jgi:hypothetical protein
MPDIVRRDRRKRFHWSSGLSRLSPRDPNISDFYIRIGVAHLLQSHNDEAIGWLEGARRGAGRGTASRLAWRRLWVGRQRPCSTVSAPRATRARRKAARCRRCWPICHQAAHELAEARGLTAGDRYSSLARLRATGYYHPTAPGNWGVPKIRALFEATFFAGLRKAGMPRNERRRSRRPRLLPNVLPSANRSAVGSFWLGISRTFSPQSGGGRRCSAPSSRKREKRIHVLLALSRQAGCGAEKASAPLCAGSAADTRPREREEARAFLLRRFRLPAPALLAVSPGPKSRSTGTRMPSPYLEQPLIPLTVLAPLLLAKIEAALANGKLDPGEVSRLRRRAEMIRGLLAPRPVG